MPSDLLNNRQLDLWDKTTPSICYPDTTHRDRSANYLREISATTPYTFLSSEKRLLIEERLTALSCSSFRASFRLRKKDYQYIDDKGIETIARHAQDFIRFRLAPANLPNDGKQTPMRGHPVFIAQHATGTCCRKCLQKWHHIPPGTALTQEQQDYVLAIIIAWIQKQRHKAPR